MIFFFLTAWAAWSNGILDMHLFLVNCVGDIVDARFFLVFFQRAIFDRSHAQLGRVFNEGSVLFSLKGTLTLFFLP